MNSIEGRTAFVTGAASGIGFALSEALAAAGARVVLADRDRARVEQCAGDLGSTTLPVHLDVVDRTAWAQARACAEEAFGPVDILVNNAGIGPDWSELADMAPEHFDTAVAVMLTGVFNGVRTFAPSMRERRCGHIVNTSSVVGLKGAPRLGGYVAAKFGVVGLSETLREELRTYDVGVSVLCPGRVNSGLIAGNEPGHRSAGDGMEPSVVAAAVLRAIRQNDFYVITHPELKQNIVEKTTRLLDAFDQAAVAAN